jgi:hypothetical protein
MIIMTAHRIRVRATARVTGYYGHGSVVPCHWATGTQWQPASESEGEHNTRVASGCRGDSESGLGATRTLPGFYLIEIRFTSINFKLKIRFKLLVMSESMTLYIYDLFNVHLASGRAPRLDFLALPVTLRLVNKRGGFPRPSR